MTASEGNPIVILYLGTAKVAIADYFQVLI